MMRSASMSLLALMLTTAAAAADAWKARAPLPHSVAGQAAAIDGDTLWVVGGSHWVGDAKRIADTISRRSLSGASGDGPWTQTSSVPGGFAHGGYAVDRGALWLAGGLARDGSVSADVMRVDLGTGAVQRVAQLPEPRAYCGAAVLDGTLWVLGGVCAEGDFSLTSGACWHVDLKTGAVTPAPAGPAFVNPLVLALDRELHVLPGSIWSKDTRRLEAPREVWIFSPVTQTWRTRPLARSLPRGLAGAAIAGQRAFLCGGFEARDGGGVIGRGAWFYDADGSLVTAPPLPQPRLAAAVAVRGGEIFVLGGEDQPRGRADTVWSWQSPVLPVAKGAR